MSTTTRNSVSPSPVRTSEPLEPKTRIVLDDVPWELYEQLRALEANGHIQMAYDDGSLVLMSPTFRHESGSRRLASFVRAVTTGLGLPCLDAGQTTWARPGKGRKKGSRKGKGKESDTAFFLANEPKMRGKKAHDPAVDPPPDLAIEVDATNSSEASLPIYARLLVPEVWRYDGVSLWIGQLQHNGTYASCDRSPGLPMLTPDLIVDWLDRVDALGETEWFLQVQAWARAELAPRHDEG